MSVLRVLAIGYVTLKDRSLPFYAMPLIRGRTLERLILRRLFQDPEGIRLRREYTEALAQARSSGDPRNTPDNIVRRRLVEASRHAIQDLRSSGAIGDDAYRRAEEELDWLELSALPAKDSA